jgi:hypothetical protein
MALPVCSMGVSDRLDAGSGQAADGESPHCARVEKRGGVYELPFGVASFDQVLSVSMQCFVDDARRPVAEVVRVAHRNFAIGSLNRSSLL